MSCFALGQYVKMSDTEMKDRSRSPRRDRDYDDRDRGRSRSPSRDRHRSSRRDRSPANGNYQQGGYGASSYGRDRAPAPPVKSFEERAQNKEQMMNTLRESSQQDRRVYVGNLSYDVKWHHLKDFMREGKLDTISRSLCIC